MSLPQEAMTLKDVKGNHPYADEFPMASEDELQELTDSVATVGLIHPVILTPDGLVLDGRNRMEACRRAGVEPTFEVREGNDDEYKEFVIGVNTTGRRESMTPQIAAAAAALILGHEKRKNGSWMRGTVGVGRSSDSDAQTMAKALRQSGLILDILGPVHLAEVRNGEASLNAKYEEARREKDRIENLERERMELAERQEREEEAAREFFTTNNAAGLWLSERTGQHKTLYAAFKQYEAENEEVRLEEERKRREEERREREHLDALKRDANRLKGFLAGYGQAWEMREHPHRDHVLNMLDPAERKRFTTIEGEITWPTTKH